MNALRSWNPVARYADLDPLARRMWGGLGSGRQDLDALFARVHPDDRDRVEAEWFRSADSDGPYEFDFRVIGEEGAPRWISARGVGGADGRRGEDVLAIFVDVTRLHAADEVRDKLVREMAHRISNLFTVAQSMTRLAAAEATDPKALATDLERRFMGLAGAYRFAVTTSGGVSAVPLEQVAEQIMAPFGGPGTVDVSLPDVPVRGEQVTNLALVLHELTTNALKYGALSEPDGKVTLRGEEDGGTVTLDWIEEGGPHLNDVPVAQGFGTHLIDHTVRSVFGGEIERRIDGGALRIGVTLDASQLSG